MCPTLKLLLGLITTALLLPVFFFYLGKVAESSDGFKSKRK